MSKPASNVLQLQSHPGGVAAGLRSTLKRGRVEVGTTGPNIEFQYIGSDPWRTNVDTGLLVPPVPSGSIGGARYLFMLARASFSTGEQSSDKRGVKLVGIRQYVDLVARIPSQAGPLAASGPPVGSTVTFRKEITDPLWHPFDGNVSWHVRVLNKGQRDTRNPLNSDGVMYQDAISPALLFQSAGPYVPPNGGVPWGFPLADLGNLHDLRYRWRNEDTQYALDIPIPVPCDIALFASVRQNDPALNPSLSDTAATQQFFALSEEDRFVVAYNAFAQYGSIAGALVFDQNIGEDVP